MIALTTTGDILRVTTSSANALDAFCTYVDNTTATFVPGREAHAIAAAVTTTVLSAPAASTQRSLEKLQLNARGGANTVTVEFFDGSAGCRLESVALASGETLEYEDGAGFRVKTVDGAFKGVGAQGATGATGAAGTNGTNGATGATGATGPSVLRCFGKATVSGGTPTVQQSQGVSSVTDTAFGQITWNLSYTFADAHWACVLAVERISNTNGTSFDLKSAIALAGQTTTSLLQNCSNDTAGLSDPTAWHFAGMGT